MTDYRFPSPGVDARFPGGGVDAYFPSPGVSARFPSPGVDLRFMAPGISGALWAAEDGRFLLSETGTRLYSRLQNDASLPLIRNASAARGLQFGVAYTESVRASTPALASLVSTEAAICVPENDMKPNVCHTADNTFDLTRPTAFVAAATAMNKPYRLHTLNWPLTAGAGGGTPVWLAAALNAGNWQRHVDQWFTAIKSAVPDPISIDVVNEPIDSSGYKSSAWLTAAGPSWMTYCFTKARELWPNALLYLCVEATEHHGSAAVQQRAAQVLSIVEAQKNAGAPIQGVALQGHLRISDGFDATRLRDYVRSLRDTLGCRVIISELDIQTGNTGGWTPAALGAAEYDRYAADMIRRYLDTVLPYCAGELHYWTPSDNQNPWGVDERPGLFNTAYAQKSTYRAVRSALLER